MTAVTDTGKRETDGHTVTTLRHGLIVRLTHWFNALCLAFLLLSGLQIFNAHPALYWGRQSDFDRPFVSLDSAEQGDTIRGVTKVGPWTFDTTGMLGASKDASGELTARGFPTWLTWPAQQDLATGRRWHFFFAWLLVVNGAIYLAYGVVRRRGFVYLWPTRADIRHLPRSIVQHAMLRFPRGPEARHYNVLQKFTYIGVIFIVLPVLVLAGLTMSPGFDTRLPLLLDLFGGRQSARTIHFICAALLVIFVIVHVVMVLVSGFTNNMRSMITGRYSIDMDAAGKDEPHA